MNKRHLIPLLLIFPVFGLFSCGGEKGEESQDIIIDDMTQFLLTKYDDGYHIDDYHGNDSSIKLPSHFQEKNGDVIPVTAISDFAFSNRAIIENIYLSNTIKSIGANAFFGSSIKKLYVTSTLEYLDSEALNNSGISLTKKDDLSFLPTTSSDTGYLLGYNTTSTLDDQVYSLTIPDGCVAIYQGVFKGFVGQINLPDSIEVIGAHAFEEANFAYSGNLKNVKRIGEKAFYCTQALSFSREGVGKYTNNGYEFRFSKALNEIGSKAFAGVSYGERTFLGASPWNHGKLYIEHAEKQPGYADDFNENYEVIYGSSEAIS